MGGRGSCRASLNQDLPDCAARQEPRPAEFLSLCKKGNVIFKGFHPELLLVAQHGSSIVGTEKVLPTARFTRNAAPSQDRASTANGGDQSTDEPRDHEQRRGQQHPFSVTPHWNVWPPASQLEGCLEAENNAKIFLTIVQSTTFLRGQGAETAPNGSSDYD